MKRVTISWVLLLVGSFAITPHSSCAQSLSSALGATKLDGLKNFADCQNQVLGHREHLIGDRLDAKLAKSTSLTAEERDIWVAEIRALHQASPSHPYKAPDNNNPQRYFLGLT